MPAVSVEKGLDDFLKLPATAARWWWATVPTATSSASVIRRCGSSATASAETRPPHRRLGRLRLSKPRRHFRAGHARGRLRGVPVAAYPVQGPVDVVVEGVSGALDHDLSAAIARALAVPRASRRAYALNLTWARTAEMFIDLWFRSSGRLERAGWVDRITSRRRSRRLGSTRRSRQEVEFQDAPSRRCRIGKRMKLGARGHVELWRATTRGATGKATARPRIDRNRRS